MGLDKLKNFREILLVIFSRDPISIVLVPRKKVGSIMKSKCEGEADK